MADKVFITCAVTGSSPVPNHPNFPFRPEHVAAEALAAAEAGAAIMATASRLLATTAFSRLAFSKNSADFLDLI